MMGEVLVDEKGVESDLPSRTSGMGLLPLKTEFEEEKIRTQVEGAFGQLDGCLGGLSGKSIEGYEIHMGRTYIDREEGPRTRPESFPGAGNRKYAAPWTM